MPALLIAVLVLFIDRLTKFIIVWNFLPGQSQPIIKGIFHISFVCNKGVAFGIFSQTPNPSWAWIVYICVIIIVFILAFYKNTFRRKDTRLFFYLILAGAIGNLIDRLFFGYVIDFLDFRIWPVFNVADSAITIGAIFLILKALKRQNVSHSF